MIKKTKIRLFVNIKLKEGEEVCLSEAQSHYLSNVMRVRQGDEISCFNGCDGEFAAEILVVHKKQTQIGIRNKIKQFKNSPDVWLVFAPLKKDCTDFLVQKSTELGVSGLLPIITQNTNTDKVKTERLQAQALEASEQCERLDVPQVFSPQDFKQVIENWDSSRRLLFMDERGAGMSVAEALSKCDAQKVAILVGPEGGFSDSEFNMLYKLPFVCGVSLGPRILRAETAAVAALSVWQAIAGDWKEKNR